MINICFPAIDFHFGTIDYQYSIVQFKKKQFSFDHHSFNTSVGIVLWKAFTEPRKTLSFGGSKKHLVSGSLV